jgi:hypothetical protein
VLSLFDYYLAFMVLIGAADEAADGGTAGSPCPPGGRRSTSGQVTPISRAAAR